MTKQQRWLIDRSLAMLTHCLETPSSLASDGFRHDLSQLTRQLKLELDLDDSKKSFKSDPK